MFEETVEKRLETWLEFRKKLEKSSNPLQEVWDFWNQAPFIPYNQYIDHYYQNAWPSPWEIIAKNKYDDFTKALMIGWTLKITKRFNESDIFLQTAVDISSQREYNLVYVDNSWVINYSDNGPVDIKNLPDSFKVENLIELTTPR